MDILKRIEEAENYLSSLGFVNFRVRISDVSVGTIMKGTITKLANIILHLI